jgi:hypothetical protein
MSVPFQQKEAVFLMDSLRPYIDFNSDLAWVKDPPAEYAANVKQVRSLEMVSSSRYVWLLIGFSHMTS